ncbi:MAG: signal peptidase II [Candidatus Poribacteria bacterium]
MDEKNDIKQKIKCVLPTIAIMFVVVALDQWTKALIRDRLALIGVSEVIKGFLEFSYSENTGAAFGTFQGRNSIFIAVGILAILFISYIYFNMRESIWNKISFGLILGGALGNLIDRIAYGFVTDFVRVRITQSIWWPNFNIADASITVGAIMFIVHKFIESSKTKNQEEQ